MSVTNFDSEILDWISFNLEGLLGPRIISGRLSNYFIPHVLIDDKPGIGLMASETGKKFLFFNIRDRRITELGIKLFFLVKMLITFINFSKLKILIEVF